MVPIEVYKELVELVEDLEDVKAFDEAKDDERIPWEEVRKQLGLSDRSREKSGQGARRS